MASPKGVLPEQGVAEDQGHPVDNDMGTTTGGTKMSLGQWKQMWMKKMPNADFAALFRSPPNMQGSAIAYFDGWMNNPDARWNPQQGVAEGSEDITQVRDAVESAIIRRIQMRHPELLRHGPQAVMHAVTEVADDVASGGLDEIGTSDISAWVNLVQDRLAGSELSEERDDRAYFNNFEQWHQAKSDIEQDDQWEIPKSVVVQNRGKTVAKWDKMGKFGWVDRSEMPVTTTDEAAPAAPVAAATTSNPIAESYKRLKNRI